MGRYLDRVKGFAQGLSGRLLLGWLAVNGLLVPLIFLGIVYIVQDSNKDLFLDHARSTARLLADMLEVEDLTGESDEVVAMLNSAQLSGQLVYADLLMDDRPLQGELWERFEPLSFREDLGFGQHGDDTYFLSIALSLGPRGSPAVLRLGFDEHPTLAVLRSAFYRALALIAAYLVLTVAFSLFIARRLTRPIEALREASHWVASGRFQEPLEVPTDIREVKQLAHDLDTMRNALFQQTQALRKANEDLQAQQARLVESETLAAVGQMASVVAHSIRNPLASIRTSAELAQELEASGPGGEIAGDIIQEVDRMDRWIREFLQFSRPGESDLEHTLDLNEVVADALDGFSRSMEKQGVAVEFGRSEAPLLLRGDPRLLEQMLNSLLSNAVEAMPEGGTLSVTTAIQAAHMELVVADTGVGMSAQQLRELFKAFETHKREGLGLGLALVERIVCGHGGTISVSSDKGVGTRVRLRFPSVAIEGERILIVDDEARLARNIQRYLERQGFQVIRAETGEAGIQAFEQHRPPLVILDFRLPDLTGLEVLSRMRAVDPGAAVIMVTGHGAVQHTGEGALEDIQALATQAGAYAFLRKPLILKELRQLILGALADRNTGRAESR